MEEDSDTEDSFFSDGSNVDSTDDEVCNHNETRQKRATEKENKSVKTKGKGIANEKSNKEKTDKGKKVASTKTKDKSPSVENADEHYEYSSDETKYAGSEDERMASNTTDEEEDSYNVFDVGEMSHPKFELGQLFPTVQLFRDAVRKQAIIERRPIKQCRNYGTRAKFVCEGEGCEWSIYCSRMKNSDTFQIKSYHRTHTCLQTFHQKQINSRWIAKHYENELRMNPTWPLSAFHKKVVND